MEEFAALAADRAGGNGRRSICPARRVPAIKPGLNLAERRQLAGSGGV
jgi:hypothetical protein